MNRLRNNGRINVSKGIDEGIIKIDEVETRGAREKFWFNDWTYLYKETYLDSHEDYAELISSEIAQALGLPCAEYDLAEYQGSPGVITKNFVDEMQGEELVHGDTIINEVYQNYILPLKLIVQDFYNSINYLNIDLEDNFDRSTLPQKKEIIKQAFIGCKRIDINSPIIEYLESVDIDSLDGQIIDIILKGFSDLFDEMNSLYKFSIFKDENDELKVNNLFDLWSILERYCRIKGYKQSDANKLIEDLANLFIYDILTLQGDRHCGNWGIIENNKTKEIRIAPTYDNANMCNLNRSKALKSIEEKIKIINTKNLPEPKKKRTLEMLMKEIYHPKSLLGVDPENYVEKQKNLLIIKQFISISSLEWLNILIEKMKLLNQDGLQQIFTKIENKINSKIPQMIKLIVSYSISLNISQICQIINETDISLDIFNGGGKVNGKK